jgi:hypothetical protein
VRKTNSKKKRKFIANNRERERDRKEGEVDIEV